jgi:hypothetical protein
MKDWKNYPRNRKVAHEDQITIIIPENHDFSCMPLFCEVCHIRFGSKEDESSYRQFKCCSSCADSWAYSHKEQWQAGWRPDKEKIEYSRNKRLFINTDILFE